MEPAEFEKTLATKPPRRFMSGDKILGRYRITGALGQGGMGTVFQCWDEVGGIDVALKAIPPELSHDTNEMEAVRDNFRLVEKLHHPHIAAAKTLEKDPATGDYYLIMECVEGLNLRKYLKRGGGKLALDIVLPVVKQVANALDYAHSQKIMHRDIKPSNIMIMANGTVKVLDFGLAAQLHTSLTRVSHVHYGTSGTGPYMAPEQWRGKFQDAATDQYALGVMVYELLSGRVPFESHEAAVLREAVLNEIPEKPAELDEAEWGVLKKALAKSRDERFANCEAFVQALEKAATGKNAMDITDATRAVERTLRTMKGEPATQITFRQAPRRSLVRVAAIVLGVALVAGMAVYLRGRARPTTESAPVARVEPKPDRVVAPLRSAAELKWNRVKGLDRGQGFGEKLDAVEVILGTATTLYEAIEYAPALAKYYEIVSGCAQIQELERQRKGARKGEDKAERLRKEAEEAKASVDAKELWNGAVKLNEEAASLFEKADFASAAKTWDAATAEFEKAAKWAEGSRASHAAKAAYEDAIEKADVTKLDEFGREEWSGVKSTARKAEALAGDGSWEEAVAKWNESAAGIEKTSVVTAFRAVEKAATACLKKVEPTLRGLSDKKPSPSDLQALKSEADRLLEKLNSLDSNLLSAAQQAQLADLKSQIENQKSEIKTGPSLDQAHENSLGMKFAPVPGTEALFCVWETRVKDFRAFVDDRENNSGYNYRSGSEPYVLKSDGWKQRGWEYGWDRPGFSQTADHPVTCMSWEDAQAFCEWLTKKEQKEGTLPRDWRYRLPTDAEWSVGVGLGRESGSTPKDKDQKVKTYPWGDQWPPAKGAGNFHSSLGVDAFEQTSPVGSFDENADGLYDMGGNVWEWCEDLYDPSKKWRVLRGASWSFGGSKYLLSSYRSSIFPPDYRGDNRGFRCVLSR